MKIDQWTPETVGFTLSPQGAVTKGNTMCESDELVTETVGDGRVGGRVGGRVDVGVARGAVARSRRFLVASIALTAVASVAWLMTSRLGSGVALADAPIVITLESVASGESPDPTDIEIEEMTFAAANSALDVPTGTSSVLATSIGGLSGVDVAAPTIERDTAHATISIVGTSDSIFHLSDVDVVILLDWDEEDPADSSPRVIVSAQLRDAELGELIGVDDGSSTSAIEISAGTITVTNRVDAAEPSVGERLLQATELPPLARAYLERAGVDASSPALALRGPVNIHALGVGGSIDPVIAGGLGLAGALSIDGTIDAPVTEFPSVSDPTAGVLLRVGTTVSLPDEILSLLSLGGATPGGTLEIREVDNGTVERSDDILGLSWTAPVVLGTPFDAAATDLRADVRDDGSGDVAVEFAADLGSWSDPFGSTWLDLGDLRLLASTSDGESTPVTVAVLAGQSSIGGRPVDVTITGSLDDPLDATITVDHRDDRLLSALLGVSGVDVDASVPLAMMRESVSDAQVTVDVTGSLAAPDLDLGVSGRIEVTVPGSTGATLGATFFAQQRVGAPESTFVVRPEGELRLSHLIVDPPIDIELVSEKTALAFVFTTDGISASRVDSLSPRLAAVLEPLVGDDPAAPVDVDAGYTVMGRIQLPEPLDTFVHESLGLQPQVFVRGTLPIGSLTSLDLELALEFDETKKPEWVHDGRLSLRVSVSANDGLDVDLTGSLTAKFRAGLPADVATTMQSLGVGVRLDEIAPSLSSECAGTAQVIAQVSPSGAEELRCYDLVTFTATASLELTPLPDPSVSGQLALVLDAGAMGEGYAWHPFGIDWLGIERVALSVGIEASLPSVTGPTSASKAPRFSIQVGLSGQVVIGGSDFLVSGVMSVDPPKPEALRLSSTAGFVLTDFFDLQRQIAVSSAAALGSPPAAPLPSADQVGIPEIVLRNVDLSLAWSTNDELCVPQGLFISADLYIDPTGPSPARGDACSEDGTPVVPPPGTTCGENADTGCITGVRIALSADGFKALAELNGFELGPIVFAGAKLDLELTAARQQLLIVGGASIDPIGSAELAVSLRGTGTGAVAEFAGKLVVGSEVDPLFVALADGSARFDRADLGENGLRLRVVLDASNRSLAGMAAEFAAEASASIDAAAADVVAALDELEAAVGDFRNDPVVFLNDGLDDLGVSIPPEAQPLVDGVADLSGEGFRVGEAAILRGELPGFPSSGLATVVGCGDLRVLHEGRCYDVGGVPDPNGFPDGGVTPDLCNSQFGDVFRSADGRCYRSDGLPDADGTPDGGVSRECPLRVPGVSLHTDGRCYEANGTPDAVGTPSGGSITLSCPLLQALDQGRCYTTTPLAGDPVGGVAKVTDIFGNAACPIAWPFEYGGRCYFVTPRDGVPDGGYDPLRNCPLLQTLVGDLCYWDWSVPDADGTPDGGVGTVCPIVAPESSGSRCYETNGAPDVDGTPNGGYRPLCGAPLVDVGGRCYLVPPDSEGTPAGGAGTIATCPDPTAPFLSSGRCYTVPPIDVPGLCDVFGLSPTCSVEDVIDQVVKPAVLAAADIASSTFDRVSSILEQIDQAFAFECASFELVLDGSQQTADVSVTLRLAGESKTFSLGFDLGKDLAENLQGVLDGLQGATSTGCVPPNLSPFAAKLFGDDGGALFAPVDVVADSYTIGEGETIVIDPLANDLLADDATITSAEIVGGASDRATVSVDDDGRRLVLSGVGPLDPGESVATSLSYDVVNPSRISTTGTAPVTVTGVNDAPTAVLDSVSFDLRVDSSIDVDVLANDSDTEDGSPTTLLDVTGSPGGGCATTDATTVVLVAPTCVATTSSYDRLAGGERLVDALTYVAGDSDGGVGIGSVEVEVTGVNDRPVVTSVSASLPTVKPGDTVALRGTFTDPDADAHSAVVDWDDGTSTTIVLPSGARTFRVEHRFVSAGRHSPSVIVTDGRLASVPSSARVSVVDGFAGAVPECAVGRYLSEGLCVLAVPGYFVPTPGADAPTPCPVGSFQPGPGADRCLLADRGHFVAAQAADVQTPCDPGRYQGVVGQTSCRDADEGFFVPAAGSPEQIECAAGTFQPTRGQSTCRDAQPGSYVDRTAATAQVPCGAGSYQPESASTDCELAGTGHFVASRGADSQTPCAPGTYQDRTGRTSCRAADPDHYVPAAGASAQIPCPGGQSQPAAGQASCVADAETDPGTGPGVGTDPDPAPGATPDIDTTDGATPVAPGRVLDTRSGPGAETVDGLFVGAGRTPDDHVVELEVAGRAGVPVDAEAVFVNVVAVSPSSVGYLTLFPCGQEPPLAANVNYVGGDIAANAVLVKVGDGGKVCIYTRASTHLVVDVNGYTAPGSATSV